jgi:hypothetical protein
MPARSHFIEFEFDLPAALLRELIQLLDAMPAAPLDTASASRIPEEQGVYQLFLNGRLVYVGKTDAEAGLRARLTRHARKVQHRHGLDPAALSFKAVRVFVFTAVDLETQLIKHYKGKGAAPAWNLSGFGSNDPGRNRDNTELKDDHFDVVHPIDIDKGCVAFEEEETMSVAKLLDTLNDAVPYNVRSQRDAPRSKRPHPELDAAIVTVPRGSHSVRSLLLVARAALGAEWLITPLPGYIIVYRENTSYIHARPL